MPITVPNPMTAPPACTAHDCEFVREVVAQIPSAPPGWAPTPGELLSRAHLVCQPGGRSRSALECLSCPRFVNYVPARDRSSVTLRCVWEGMDTVGELMTISRAIPSVASTELVSVAEEFARESGVDHLIVVDKGSLVGIVCRCDLALTGREEIVASCMAEPVLVVDPDTSFADAVAIMSSQRIGCLPVVVDGILEGVLRRSDLFDLGVEPELLGVEGCAACGSSRELHMHPYFGAIDVCLDCIDQVVETIADDEIGGGD